MVGQEEGLAETHNIKSMRLNKKRFKIYLSRLYNQKMADKIINLFDFVNPLDLAGFCKQVDEIFIKSSSHQESSGKYLKVLAF